MASRILGSVRIENPHFPIIGRFLMVLQRKNSNRKNESNCVTLVEAFDTSTFQTVAWRNSVESKFINISQFYEAIPSSFRIVILYILNCP